MANPFKLLFELRALWFVLFYGVLAAVFLLKERYSLRKPFLAGFFALLCLTVLVGTPFLPFMAWDKFSNTYPTVETEYELRVFTEDGRDLVYDIRATLGTDGVNEEYLTTDMAEEYSYCTNIETLEYLLERARIYRAQVENRSIRTFARFPPHGLTNIWSKREVRGYSRFVGIRLYEVEYVSSADGTSIRSTREALLVEYDESKTYECPSLDSVRGGT